MQPIDGTIVVIFVVVYLGMLLGGLPGMALDRTGVALLGAIALFASQRLSPQVAWASVDFSTMALLFGLMIVSAQLRLGGFYTHLTRRLIAASVSPAGLLALLIAVAGGLSAVLANDVVCLAMTPIIVEACIGRRLDPVPFLLGLAAAANVGSAATLIGNPQNMLIGQTLQLSFSGYLFDAAVPSIVGLGIVWLVISRQTTGRWHREMPQVGIVAPRFDPWQAGKGIAILVAVILGFVLSDWPRDAIAMTGAGVLMTSRRMASRAILALVDWQLLVLFMGLFMVNGAMVASGALEALRQTVQGLGIDLHQPAWLFGLTVVSSNLVSNVPAVMLLLSFATHPLAGPILALASTLAGNLVLIGSIANLIVVDQAAKLQVTITWRRHAAVGVPITIATLIVAAAWLWLRA